MQAQVPVQLNHCLLIVYHHHYHLLRLHFPVYCKKVEVKEEEPNPGEPVGTRISGVGVLNTPANTRLLHYAFQFSALCPRKIEVYISHKCIYSKIQTIHQVINGLLRDKNYRLLCLDDESNEIRQRPTSKYYYRPALQEQEIDSSPEYDDDDRTRTFSSSYGRNRNTGSSNNTPRCNPSNHRNPNNRKPLATFIH